jgi:iron only hydrogenase large subunit-like protein
LHRVYRRVQAFCSQVLGFEHVYDITFARHIALLEHAQEFQERRKGEGKLPMIASACPGWICYAEKAHPEMLPFIARTKSPQQVIGTLVKEWLGEKWGKKSVEISTIIVRGHLLAFEQTKRDIPCLSNAMLRQETGSIAPGFPQ